MLFSLHGSFCDGFMFYIVLIFLAQTSHARVPSSWLCICRCNDCSIQNFFPHVLHILLVCLLVSFQENPAFKWFSTFQASPIVAMFFLVGQSFDIQSLFCNLHISLISAHNRLRLFPPILEH